jgi:hypothetical protein
MMLYKPVNLKCFEIIQKEVSEYMKKFKESNLVFAPAISQELRNTVNKELGALGFAEVFDILLFKRRGTPRSENMCHMDGDKDILTSTSLIVPVSGCKGTAQYWYGGPYETVIQSYTPPGSKQATATYRGVKWNGPAEYLGEVEIFEQPYLTRVDLPHGAYDNGKEDRITITFRFKNNIPFEEACKLFDTQKDKDEKDFL